MNVVQVERIDPAALLPGDVLLMRSAGEFSSLVAWLGESGYSHAAIYAGDGIVLEAITAGVSETRLEVLLGDDEGVEWIDAWRGAAHDGVAYTEGDRSAIAARARHYLGKPFAMSGLFMLGVFAAMRDRSEIRSRGLRRLLRMVFEQVVAKADGSELICSELVYRSLREGEARPPGKLRPVILERVPNPSPMPALDLGELALEISRMLGIGGATLVAHDPYRTFGPDGEDAAFDQAHARVRMLLGLPPQGSVAGWARVADVERGPKEIPDPVPRLVRPRELEVSPSLELLGRLK